MLPFLKRFSLAAGPSCLVALVLVFGLAKHVHAEGEEINSIIPYTGAVTIITPGIDGLGSNANSYITQVVTLKICA